MAHAPRSGRTLIQGPGRKQDSLYRHDEHLRAPSSPRSWSAGRRRALRTRPEKPNGPAEEEAASRAAQIPLDAIALLTDRPFWAEAVIDQCASLELPVERWAWDGPHFGEAPYRALAIDVDDPDGRVWTVLERLAALAWQPLCLVSLAQVPGAAEASARLDGLGFDRVLPMRNRPAYWTAVRGGLDVLLRGDAWLLPLVCRALGCHDPVIVRALARVLDPLPGRRTVTRWASALGYRRRQDLGALFDEHGLPSPKCVLDLVRLARVSHTARSRPRPVRAELARRFGYSSGDYLGKRAKQLTGWPLSRLIRVGPALPLGILARTARPSRDGRSGDGEPGRREADAERRRRDSAEVPWP